jgi:hypothetical protein
MVSQLTKAHNLPIRLVAGKNFRKWGGYYQQLRYN